MRSISALLEMAKSQDLREKMTMEELKEAYDYFRRHYALLFSEIQKRIALGEKL